MLDARQLSIIDKKATAASNPDGLPYRWAAGNPVFKDI